MNTYHPLPPYTPPSGFTNDGRVHFNDAQVYTEVSSKKAYRGKNSILPKVGQVIVSIALAAITATAAYYMLQYGARHLNCPVSGMDTFAGGAVFSMGTMYAVAAFANLCLCFPCVQREMGRNSRNKSLSAQVGVSILAPLAFVGFGLAVADAAFLRGPRVMSSSYIWLLINYSIKP